MINNLHDMSGEHSYDKFIRILGDLDENNELFELWSRQSGKTSTLNLLAFYYANIKNLKVLYMTNHNHYRHSYYDLESRLCGGGSFNVKVYSYKSIYVQSHLRAKNYNVFLFDDYRSDDVEKTLMKLSSELKKYGKNATFIGLSNAYRGNEYNEYNKY